MLRKKKVLCPEQAQRVVRKSKGQSTVEYIILVAVIIGAVLAFAAPFRRAFTASLNSGTNGMQNMADRLRMSRPLSP